MCWCLKFFLIVLCLFISVVKGQNCRGSDARLRECDSLCDSNGKCKIRAALLLPKNTTYYASHSSVQPVFDLALKDPIVQNAFPPWLEFEWTTYDVEDCDAAYAIISAIDAYTYDCSHVFFGPACDYALASVARIAKFLGNTGTPMLTTGAFTFDFVQPKLTCQDEFYMLVRTGLLGFKDMAYFIISVMRQFEWAKVALLYETHAYNDIVGISGGFLLASTLSDYFIFEGISVLGREYIPSILTYEDLLLQTVGNEYASESSAEKLWFSNEHVPVLNTHGLVSINTIF